MPRIFDNIDLPLLDALRDTLGISKHADFCVGYFNLRGWKLLQDLIEPWPGGDGHCCRLLVGMQRLPQEDLREAFALSKSDDELSRKKTVELKRQAAEEFRKQL